MNGIVALDTSAAIPLLVKTHAAHSAVTRWWSGREVTLCGHSLAETYAVLTRLPGDVRLSPIDAARLMADRFATPLLMSTKTTRRLPEILAARGIAGGATYDAMIALTALDHECTLATRDARAKTTYDIIGATVEVIS